MSLCTAPRRTRLPRVFALVVSLTGLMMPSMTLAADPIDPEVETVLRERLVLLAEVVKLQQSAFMVGESGFANVLESIKALTEARLELARDKKERIAIRTDLLQNATSLEKHVQDLFSKQQATRIDLLNAQAATLRAKADFIAERKSGD